MFADYETITYLWPEIILIAVAVWLYVGGAFWRLQSWWTMFTVLGFVVAGVTLWTSESAMWSGEVLTAPLYKGPLAIDFLGYNLRWLALVTGLLFVLLVGERTNKALTSEHLGTLVLVTVGVMLVSRANEFVFLFVALEMVSIPTYVLLFLGRRDRACAESALKYFFLSIFASAILLYGVSFLYGAAGATVFAGLDGSLREQLATASSLDWAARMGMVLILAGLGFKIAAAPFHFYAPDVYEGTSNANVALLAVAPKIAGVAALIRITIIAAPALAEFTAELVLLTSALTMTLGNVCALWQKNIRRLMGYSSVAHAGYLLIGLSMGLISPASASEFGGVAAMLFYLYVYVLATIALFSIIDYLGGPAKTIDHIEQLSGLNRSHPLAAAGIAVCMFSLAGIPPMAGFWGKLTLFSSAVGAVNSAADEGAGAWLGLFVVIAGLNAAIAAAYYLRIVGVMYFGTQQTTPEARGQDWTMAAARISFAMLFIVSLFPGPALENAHQAVRSALTQPIPTAEMAEDAREGLKTKDG